MRPFLPLLTVLLLAGCAAPGPQAPPLPDPVDAAASSEPGEPSHATDSAAPAGPAPAAPDSAAPDSAARPPLGTGVEKRFGDAVIAPLVDLNLLRPPIPPVLAAARASPYATPAELSCTVLGAEIELLDAALGADLDTAATADDPGLVERGTSMATDAMIGAVRNTTEGVIPFRGWVRKLSGADRHARDMAAGIAAGTVRRAYLKGLGQATGCPAPAAPRQGAGPRPEQ